MEALVCRRSFLIHSGRKQPAVLLWEELLNSGDDGVTLEAFFCNGRTTARISAPLVCPESEHSSPLRLPNINTCSINRTMVGHHASHSSVSAASSSPYPTIMRRACVRAFVYGANRTRSPPENKEQPILYWRSFTTKCPNLTSLASEFRMYNNLPENGRAAFALSRTKKVSYCPIVYMISALAKPTPATVALLISPVS